MVPSKASPEVVRLLASAYLATASPKQLRKMRKFLEHMIHHPDFRAASEQASDLTHTVGILLLAERHAKLVKEAPKKFTRG